jgi:small GTP-binding protein
MPSLQLMMVGPAGVGKTSILKRFIDDEFSERVDSTIGIKFLEKKLEEDESRLRVLDTPGNPEFFSADQSFLKNTDAVMLVLTNQNISLNNLPSYLRSIPANVPIYLVVNKCETDDDLDSVQSRYSLSISPETQTQTWRLQQQLKEQFKNNAFPIEPKFCSAKSGAGVKDIFEDVVRTQPKPVVNSINKVHPALVALSIIGFVAVVMAALSFAHLFIALSIAGILALKATSLVVVGLCLLGGIAIGLSARSKPTIEKPPQQINNSALLDRDVVTTLSSTTLLACVFKQSKVSPVISEVKAEADEEVKVSGGHVATLLSPPYEVGSRLGC